MNIKVTGCHDCPFCYTEYDEWSIGFDALDICVMARIKNLKDNIIRAYNSYPDSEDEIKTPEWCPLKKESINIEWK